MMRMNDLPPRPTAIAQGLLSELSLDGKVVVDATAGNGYDTVFLANCVGETGKVLVFDVQEAAIAATRERAEGVGLGGRVEFFRESHALMGNHAEPGTVAAVMFNLGYLPGADHEVTTGGDTIRALEAAEILLVKGGVLSVVCYPGHEGGDEEAKGVVEWMEKLPERGWRVVRYGAVGTRRPAPFLLFGVKD